MGEENPAHAHCWRSCTSIPIGSAMYVNANTDAADAEYPLRKSAPRMARVRKRNGAMAAANPSVTRNLPVENNGVSSPPLKQSVTKNAQVKRYVGSVIGSTPYDSVSLRNS